MLLLILTVVISVVAVSLFMFAFSYHLNGWTVVRLCKRKEWIALLGITNLEKNLGSLGRKLEGTIEERNVRELASEQKTLFSGNCWLNGKTCLKFRGKMGMSWMTVPGRQLRKTVLTYKCLKRTEELKPPPACNFF